MPQQPIRFSLIDRTNIEDHARLELTDRCAYLFEYTSRRNYSFSETNNLISNLKKKPGLAATNAYKYKRHAIANCSAFLRGALAGDWLAAGTLVPVPPSKSISHPDYDDRMERICGGIANGADVRMLVRQTISMNAAHESGDQPRPTVQQLVDCYEIDESLSSPAPTSIGIVDDVLTAGTHFKAMQYVLAQRFPSADISGIFIARRIFPPEQGAMIFAPDDDP